MKVFHNVRGRGMAKKSRRLIGGGKMIKQRLLRKRGGKAGSEAKIKNYFGSCCTSFSLTKFTAFKNNAAKG